MATLKKEVCFEKVVARGCRLDVYQEEVVSTVNETDIEKETCTFLSTMIFLKE